MPGELGDPSVPLHQAVVTNRGRTATILLDT